MIAISGMWQLLGLNIRACVGVGVGGWDWCSCSTTLISLLLVATCSLTHVHVRQHKLAFRTQRVNLNLQASPALGWPSKVPCPWVLKLLGLWDLPAPMYHLPTFFSLLVNLLLVNLLSREICTKRAAEVPDSNYVTSVVLSSVLNLT